MNIFNSTDGDYEGHVNNIAAVNLFYRLPRSGSADPSVEKVGTGCALILYATPELARFAIKRSGRAYGPSLGERPFDRC